MLLSTFRACSHWVHHPAGREMAFATPLPDDASFTCAFIRWYAPPMRLLQLIIIIHGRLLHAGWQAKSNILTGQG